MPEWSPSLTSLDLSHNRLTNIGGNPAASSLTYLNLANNRLGDIPPCIHGFVKLSSLCLQHNKMISRESLESLRIHGNLTLCSEDTKNQSTGMGDSSQEGVQIMKVVVLGESGSGKTTLASVLSGSEGKVGTGLVINTWKLRQGLNDWRLHLKVWELSGDQSNTAYRCLLSEHCICILLFNLKKGVSCCAEEMRTWVKSIATWAPGSCVILVGTHLDELSNQQGAVQDFVHAAADLSAYQTALQVQECLAVGLKGTMQNVDMLKEVVCRHAVRHPINNGHLATVDRRLPTSYTDLVCLGESIQSDVKRGACKPVLRKEEFKELVLKSNLVAHEDDDMVGAVGSFLTMTGVILHYDNPSHNLSDIYFMDPHFLCKAVLHMVRSPFIRRGILHTRHLPAILGNNCLVSEYLEQYVTLLHYHRIVLAVDNQTLLIPSMVPDEQPVGTDVQEVGDKSLYTRHFLFHHPAGVSPGMITNFWNQLLIHTMHFVPRVRFALGGSPPCLKKSASPWASGQPVLIPNVQGVLPYKPESHLGAMVTWWRRGIVYHDPELEFRVALLGDVSRTTFEGVLITASRNPQGAKCLGQLVKIVARLLVSALEDKFQNEEVMEVKQVVPCHICMELEHPSPYAFKVGKCFSLIAANKFYAKCKQDCKEDRHTVPVSDLVPDFMLHDLDPSLLTSICSLSFGPSEKVLGRGNFSTVYSSRHKGTSVAVKVFHGSARDAFTQLRKEATLLHNLRHPFVVPLIGALLNPAMALLTLEAPLGSLDKVFIKRRQLVPRLVLHRIAAQVAAALSFLHTNGIMRCNCKASDILLWSIDPTSLFHCKLADLGMAKELEPIGIKLPHGVTEFIAPEALTVNRRGEHCLYDKRADVYSYAMLLYQMIARKDPFTGVPHLAVKPAVLRGERPELQVIPLAETAYFYLTRLMQRCWDGHPSLRPTTADIVHLLCLPSVQSVMAVHQVETEHSVHGAHLSMHARATATHDCTLWVCCDGASGIEVLAYGVKTMSKQQSYLITDQQLLHCSHLTKQHLWVCTSRRHGNSELHAFNVHSRELEKWIPLQEHAVCCMESADGIIYCGTHEGLCLAFDQETGLKCASQKLSDYTVDSLSAAPDIMWVSNSYRIFLLDLTTLKVRAILTRPEQDLATIGRLCASLQGDTIWSANVLNSARFTSWSKDRRTHKFDVDAKECLTRIDHRSAETNAISVLTPILDTVWVAMVTGHILVFCDREVLTCFHPYTEYVRFLTCLHCEGPDHSEKAVVVSGAKGFIPSMVAGLGCKKDVQSSSKLAVTLVMWEAFPSKQCQQMQFVHDNSACLTAGEAEMASMVTRGGFSDGTPQSNEVEPTTDLAVPVADLVETTTDDANITDLSNSHRSQGLHADELSLSRSTCNIAFSGEPSILGSMCPVPLSSSTDILHVRLPRIEEAGIQISCPRPVRLEFVLSRLAEWQQNNSVLLPLTVDDCVLSYYLIDSIESVFIRSQMDLDYYLLQMGRPPLLLMQRM